MSSYTQVRNEELKKILQHLSEPKNLVDGYLLDVPRDSLSPEFLEFLHARGFAALHGPNGNAKIIKA